MPQLGACRVLAHSERGLLVLIAPGSGKRLVFHVPSWTYLGGEEPE